VTDPLDMPAEAGLDVHAVTAALHVVRSRIDAVERNWTHDVEITAVTKAHAPQVIELAVAAGCTSVGENYAQELLTKQSTIDSMPLQQRPRVDFIGQLQSNKVRQIAGLVGRWATVDRVALADEIAQRDAGARVLIQVNSTGELQKGGCDPVDAEALVSRCRERGLHVEGLMTVGPTSGIAEDAVSGFRLVRRLVDDLGLSVCSMGMTGDLEQAVACGATNVRIGSALFGARTAISLPVHPRGDRPG
jgi:PLP dependent protein